MPRRQRELGGVAPPVLNRSILASSARLNGLNATRIYTVQDREWQKECYHHYRQCGEARFAAEYFGHALSKAVLYVVDDPYNPKAPRMESGPAVDALHELFNGTEGQTGMLASLGVHLTIAGECYLIGRAVEILDDKGNPTGNTQDCWEIRSISEVQTTGNGQNSKWFIKSELSGQATIPLSDDDTVIRIWMPDPENSVLATSPFRSLLTILREIEWLTKYVFAQASSRLGGAGVWFVAEEIDFPDPPEDPDNPGRNEDLSTADKIMARIAESILKPIEDPSNPAAKVPLVATIPGEYLQTVKDGWLTFWGELDTAAKELRGEAIQRFALGMDMPMEKIIGISSNMGSGGGRSNGVSHWGAWQIDEETIKMHVEPMLDVIVQSLTMQYIRPGSGDDTATLRYDTTALKLRPDRSQESIELYNLGIVSKATVARENGFDVGTDLMGNAEFDQWLTLKVASGSATPDMVNAALKQLGVDLGPTGDASGADGMNESRPPPSITDHPNRDLPEEPQINPAEPPQYRAEALIAACDALSFRALERAGNRLRSKSRGVSPDVPSHQVHTAMPGITKTVATAVMDGAWTCADDVIAGTGANPDKVLPVLDGYVTNLVLTSRAHTRDALVTWMAQFTKKP